MRGISVPAPCSVLYGLYPAVIGKHRTFLTAPGSSRTRRWHSTRFALYCHGGRIITQPGRKPTIESNRIATRLQRTALLGCLALIIYGTLFPFTNWRLPQQLPWPLDPSAGIRISRTDILANMLLYMPLGGLLAARRAPRLMTLLTATLVAGCLSLVLETLQLFIPGRVSSVLDTSMNTLGACVGAGIILLMRKRTAARRQPEWSEWIATDRLSQVGCAALAAWLCAQLIPFVPSLDVSNLRHGLSPLWYALIGQAPISISRVLVYLAAVAGLMPIAAMVLRRHHPVALATFIFLAVPVLKVLVIWRQLSAEALLGILGGIALAGACRLIAPERSRPSAAILIVCSILAAALHPGSGTLTHAFNWIPFQEQLAHPVTGLMDLADASWPFLALAYLRGQSGRRPTQARSAASTAAIAVALFGLEWAQYWVPGRYPDITDVIIGAAAWWFGILYAASAGGEAALSRESEKNRLAEPRSRHS